MPWNFFSPSLQSFCCSSSCNFLTDIEVDSKSELPIHSFSQASSCKLTLSQVLRQTYSFNSGLTYLEESQIKLFHYPRKTRFFSITTLKPCIDSAAPWHMVLAKQAVTATQSIESVEKAFRRKENEYAATFKGQAVAKELGRVMWNKL